MTKLEQIRHDLNKYIEDQLGIDPASRDWEVFAFEDKLCEVIDELDYVINYDPTPEHPYRTGAGTAEFDCRQLSFLPFLQGLRRHEFESSYQRQCA